MPPPGGYPPIRTLRSAPKKGFSNITLLLIAGGVMTYGFAHYIIRVREYKSVFLLLTTYINNHNQSLHQVRNAMVIE